MKGAFRKLNKDQCNDTTVRVQQARKTLLEFQKELMEDPKNITKRRGKGDGTLFMELNTAEEVSLDRSQEA